MTSTSAGVDRAVDLLEAIASSSGGEPLLLSDVARAIQLHVSTAHRLLKRLETRGLVERIDGGYVIGLRAFELGTAWTRRNPVKEHAKPIMEELASAVNETTHLGILEGDEVVYIEKVEGSHAVRTSSEIGRRMPAHSTAVGKALLAYAQPTKLASLRDKPLVRRTPNTIVTWAKLDRELERIRRRGYSTDDCENEEGVRCVGAPVFDHAGKLIASLSISAPLQRGSDARMKEIAAVLVQAANRLSARLGHQSPARGRTAAS